MEEDEDVWEEFGKLNAKYVKQGLQLEACGKLYATARDELVEAKKALAEITSAIDHWLD